MSNKSHGTVKWLDNAKGYGFIINDDGEDVMVHYRSIMGVNSHANQAIRFSG